MNPKDIQGQKKPPLHLIPASADIAESAVLALGAEKYGAFNWRGEQIHASVYISAAKRHLAQWFDGEGIDPESGQSHLAHARACLSIMLDALSLGKLLDDRPTKGEASRLIKEATKVDKMSTGGMWKVMCQWTGRLVGEYGTSESACDMAKRQTYDTAVIDPDGLVFRCYSTTERK